jgi:hypothetical protein
MIKTTRHRQYRHRQALASSACALLAAALTLAATAVGEPAQLHITSDPAGATISVDGTSRGVTPMTLSTIIPGKHILLARKQGYHTSRETIVLGAGERTTREFTLKPILGLILVHSTPAGADIEVDGAHRGVTPTLINDLPLGRYRARLVKPGYIPREIEMTIDSRSPKKFDIQLTSDSATLALDSEPPGAAVTLNGVARGTTPCHVDRIPSGESTLELSLTGFEPYSESLKLAAGENQTITASLKSIPSDLAIVSIPPGARIYVDNQFRGTAPVKLTKLPPNTYRIRAELAAHDLMLRNVTIGRAQDIVEEFRLQRNAGGLAITTEPAGVTILLNGKDVGTTAIGTNATDRVSETLSVDLVSCGTHVLALTKPGYYEAKTDIDVVRDQTLTRHYRLKRRFIPNYEIKTDTEVYRGILIEVDEQKNVKLETHPGIFKTLMRDEIRFVKPLRETQLENATEE